MINKIIFYTFLLSAVLLTACNEEEKYVDVSSIPSGEGFITFRLQGKRQAITYAP
ncbi:hypothetical protein M2459_001474 [Parabacteroides sp. PF5-5]|uniref:hypothetical protein n=1 Tax=unclassified Parabacteroides TaxID=2649774 RepID=UPI002476C36D|nr:MULTISPECIES: hypothetical protein [unclassified Parabacteroides]MDH6304737.1 hypothetical protein [Parabacteroides sp. PH5-39]MDH6315648.1 hypothetical protein [Parabacteroides sp. PF5-13]MDH6319309.1 hypothetical protein [Parabacteroides sp. PH5-13]MDH6323040.1 hypothetical protein [Parabacteroides sp. PH5-8]MDH6326841.1 hypothetical protein [Parabacteroides sp. PH5-41]